MYSLEQNKPSGYLIIVGLFVNSKFHVKDFQNKLYNKFIIVVY